MQMIKKYLIITSLALIGAVFGFLFLNSSQQTFYIKNNAPYLPAANIHQKIYQAEDKIGDISNAIIPPIKIPENLTESFAKMLAKEIIDKSSRPKDAKLPAEPGLDMPDPNKIAEEFIKNGLKQANENILNIKPPTLEVSIDNSKGAVEFYLTETQKVLKDNLNGEPLLSILEDINKNNGKGLEKLLPIISAHEAAANQIEKIAVPSGLKDLITEEIQMLRITANILRVFVNIESDPMSAIAAIKQFETMMQNWAELQQKFNIFIEKFNKA